MLTGLLITGLVLTVVGTGIGVAASISANAKAQEERREQAKYQQDVANYQRDTALGTMEKQLISSMEQDYMQAQDLESQRNANAISSAQSSYVGQLAAEEQYTRGLAQNARNMGEVTLAMGSSGAQEDTALATVINAEMTADAAAQRSQIDKTRGMGTFQRDTANQASRTAQTRIEQRYEPGSAVRGLYDFQRERVTGGAALETTYLQSVIDDNSDYLSWSNWWGSDAMWGDLLTAGAGLVDIGKWALGAGAFGTPALSGQGYGYTGGAGTPGKGTTARNPLYPR